MARNTSITLGEHFDEFIAHQLGDGRFGSASEVIRAGLRLLEENETKLKILREALQEGEQSGFVDYSYDSIVAELNETELGE
jgi:antitoxin ParD1/3/4